VKLKGYNGARELGRIQRSPRGKNEGGESRLSKGGGVKQERAKNENSRYTPRSRSPWKGLKDKDLSGTGWKNPDVDKVGIASEKKVGQLGPVQYRTKGGGKDMRLKSGLFKEERGRGR